jgi:hypothetical protein
MTDMDDRAISVDPKDLSVDIGFPCGPNIPWQTAMSLAKTVKACTERRIECGVACIAGSSVVTWARSKVLDTFLQGHAKHLFWIDSDITWEPADFIRLLALATKYDVVCGTYAQKTPEQTIVIRHTNLCKFNLNPHGLVKVDGAGLGFAVITRDVAQRITDSKPKVYDPAAQKSMADAFRLDRIDRGHEHEDCRHEDVAFFADLTELGYSVWLDPTIQLGHIGPYEYRSDPLKALRLDAVSELTQQTAGAM